MSQHPKKPVSTFNDLAEIKEDAKKLAADKDKHKILFGDDLSDDEASWLSPITSKSPTIEKKPEVKSPNNVVAVPANSAVSTTPSKLKLPVDSGSLHSTPRLSVTSSPLTASSGTTTPISSELKSQSNPPLPAMSRPPHDAARGKSETPSNATGTSSSSSVGAQQVESKSSEREPQTIETSVEDSKAQRAVIFRKPTSLPEDELVDINRPIDDTRYLARVLQELPEGSARREPLALLSKQVVEQFGLRLVRSPAILQEVTVLSSVPDAELLHKLLQQFLNLLDKEAALDVDLLEGLAVLLEGAHPDAITAKKSAGTADSDNTLVDNSLATKVKKGINKVENLISSSMSDAVSAKVGSIREAFKSFLTQKGLLKQPPSSSSTTTVAGQIQQTSSAPPEQKNILIPSAQQKLSPTGSAVARYNQIQHLLSLLDKLTEKYEAFHRQAQTAVQEAELLRALARVLDAMRDIGVTGIQQESVRHKVYKALIETANMNDTDKVDVTVSLWANYAIQALIRLEDNGSSINEWLTRGKHLAVVIKSLKELWNTWDLSKLGDVYDAGKEAFKVGHQPESWYESLWYCQLLIRAGQFQALEEYLYQTKPGKDGPLPLCPDRCMPAFQLGLIAALDGVISDPKWSDTVKFGCLQLLQDLFLNEAHWYTEPTKSKDHTWLEYFKGKVESTKKLALYTGQAYQARKQAVQGAVLEQLVAYLQNPALNSQAQAVLSALRHPSIKPPLTNNQSQLLEQHAPLVKILRVSQTGSALTSAKPSQILLVPAREAVEKQLAWKLDMLRASVLTAADQERALAYYVPPKGLRKDQDKDPAFDLLEASLHFLGLTPENPAERKAATKPADGQVEHTAESKEDRHEIDQDDKPLTASRRQKQEEPELLIQSASSSITTTSSSIDMAEAQQSTVSSAAPTLTTLSAVELGRCTIDCRRTTGTVDPNFVSQWRRTYGYDATRFLLVYCEATDEQQQKAARENKASAGDKSDSTVTGSWYFCGQSGEGECLEGVIEKDQAWLENISSKAKECLLNLPALLTILINNDNVDVVTVLQDPSSAVGRQIKQHLLHGLNHLSVVNQKPVTPQPHQVLLLTGGAGSGKSTYGLYLQRFLWQNYRSGGYIPVFIPLVQLANPDKAFIEDFFKQKGFSDSDIRQFKDPKNGYRFLFIFDGYDELTGLKGQNLFHTNKLHEWPGCRVIIGCRAELLVGDDPKWFAPRDEKGQPQPDKLLTRWVAPFDSTQTENYLKKYVRQKREQQALTHEAWDGWTDWRQYQEEINKLSSIRELIERPFMLTILVDILPAMKREREDSLASISRLDLYDMFMRQWFKRAKDKVTPEMLTNAQHYGAPQYAFRFREGEAIELDYQEFCENLAMYLFKRGQSTALYQRQWQLKEQGADLVRHELDHFFKTSDPAVQLVLRGCPVIPQGMNRYGYLHKSIWEYFVACRVYREISCSAVPWVLSTEQPAITESKSAATSISTSTSALPSAELSSKAKKQKVRTKLRSVIPFLSLYQQTQERRAASRMIEGLAEQDPSQLWFNQRLLTVEPSVVRFLADFAQRDPRFQRTLLHWVNCSKRRSDITIASANAITILNTARFPFSGMDLRNVRIAGADLGLGIFDHTDFTGADLSKVNFANAFLRGACFDGCQMEGVYFDANDGQEVLIGQIRNKKGQITAPDGKMIFFIDKNGDEVRVYDIVDRQFLPSIQSPKGEKISCIVVSPNSSLAFLYDGVLGRTGSSKVLVYDMLKHKILIPIQAIGGEKISHVTITSDNQLALLAGGHQILTA